MDAKEWIGKEMKYVDKNSKAILLLDEMPVRCIDCPYMYVVKNPHISEYCKAIIDKGFYPKIENVSERPKWCPLKPIPKKRKLPADMVDYTNYGEEPWFTDGYNACIDEILGEEND